MHSEIQAYLRGSAAAGRQTGHIGPFLTTLNLGDPNPWLNYAIPDDRATPSPDDVDRLTEFYRSNARHPRLEYVSTAAPDALPILLQRGYSIQSRLALMVWDSSAAAEPHALPEVVITEPRHEGDLAAIRTVQHKAYGETSPPTAAQITALASSIKAGGGARLAISHGEPAGAGEFTRPRDGLSEITSIAVRVEYRRHGIGAALAAALTRGAVTAGSPNPFLMADEDEARTYSRVGYRTIGEILAVWAPM